MSSSDSFNAPSDTPDADTAASGIDPAIAEAVDVVANRFGAPGLEHMIGYAQQSLTGARAALEELRDSVE